MVLPDELYQRMTDAVTIVGRDEPRADDRRVPRVKLSTQIKMRRAGGESSARVRDLSAGGVGLFHDDRVALDERIVLEFPTGSDSTVLIEGTVAYWEPLAENLFGIGVAFERVIDRPESIEWAAPSTGVIGMIHRITHGFARKAS